MAGFSVQSSAAIQGIIDNLERQRKTFQEEANAVAADISELPAKWTGDASDAFQQHWSKEKDNFIRLDNAVGEYIDALRLIKERYEAAEEQAKQLAEQ